MKPCLEPAQSLLWEALKRCTAALASRNVTSGLISLCAGRYDGAQRDSERSKSVEAVSQTGCTTFRIQCVNLEGQRRVLQMKLSGGGHDLDLTDDVDDGVATQHLSRDCKNRTNHFHNQYVQAVVANKGKARTEIAIIKDKKKKNSKEISPLKLHW